MSAAELDAKREMLLSARIRFSPSGAGIRDAAVDRIIEQCLFGADKKGISAETLLTQVRVPSGTQILNIADIRAGIARLQQAGRITDIETEGRTRHGLSQSAQAEVGRALSEATERHTAVAQDLFGAAKGKPESYAEAFLHLLSKVFSKMSSAYVAIIAGRDPENGYVQSIIPQTIHDVLASHPVAEPEAFKHGVTRFFSVSDPRFDAIKWNMAQNHYIVKALGIDPSAHLLSSDLLKGATLYLDTNVLIGGLIQDSRHHGGIIEVLSACSGLSIGVKVAQITAQELQRTIAANAASLRRVFEHIPSATLTKVHSFLLEGYLAARHDNSALTLDEYIGQVQKSAESLKEVFGVEIADDHWFDTEAESPPTAILAAEIAERYRRMRNRKKSEAASLHDALLIRWIAALQDQTAAHARIVTLDMTLVARDKESTQKRAHVITLDALIQWTTPHTCKEEATDHLAAIYAAALRYQLLPSDQIFEARDFQVFADMEVETGQLPAADVEACIREIRKLGPSLDPGRAEDREKIAGTVQRFFADPGTKYKRDIVTLGKQNRELAEKLDQEIRLREQAETTISELKGNAEALAAKNREQDKAISDERKSREVAEVTIAGVRDEVTGLRQQIHHEQLRRQIVFRLLIIAIPVSGIWWWVTMVALVAGEGATWFQKITNAWSWYGLPLAVAIALFPFVMGRERMRHLKWWKGESD